MTGKIGACAAIGIVGGVGRADVAALARAPAPTEIDPVPPSSSSPAEKDADRSLMRRIAEGEEAAVGELYDRFGALVFQSARQVLNSRAEADDAVQEVFVRLWKTADRFDPERAKLVTWVMLICRRHLIDRLRRRGARPDMGAGEGPALDQSPAADPQASLEDVERRRIRDRVAELPELQREVIERAYLQGFTLREVAQQLDAPLGTVKSALSRGLGRLRERFAESDLPGAPGSDRETS